MMMNEFRSLYRRNAERLLARLGVPPHHCKSHQLALQIMLKDTYADLDLSSERLGERLTLRDGDLLLLLSAPDVKRQ